MESRGKPLIWLVLSMMGLVLLLASPGNGVGPTAATPTALVVQPDGVAAATVQFAVPEVEESGLRLIGQQPAATAEMGLDEPLEIYFSQPM
ncbi:MAG: hypothetical protein KDE28_12190, partial [Anaerolineales bacterium]|nr:hypothetical protein [Anaerolineales bacterium]